MSAGRSFMPFRRGASGRAAAAGADAPVAEEAAPAAGAAAQAPAPDRRDARAGRRARPPRIGLALGSGAARGWAHIGALRVLGQAGFVPEVIVGSSIGAVVGGCLATGALDALEGFALSLTRRRVMGLLDLSMGGSGLLGGARLRNLLQQDVGEHRIEELPVRYAAVATELGTGNEVWLTRGSIVEAMRASYALPGIFDPVCIGERWLMDGALVNPVPVTVARALGAEFVLAINLNGNLRASRASTIPGHGPLDDDEAPAAEQEARPRGLLGAFSAARRRDRRAEGAPGIGAVLVDAFNITQDRIARSRLAGDPPNLMISPRLGQIGLFDFHRAEESMRLGAEAAERALPELEEMLAAAAIVS